MNAAQSIVEALESLSSNKMRSGLTILGIVIGVAAVIAMLAIGEGAQSSITGTIEGIGTNLLFIQPGNTQADVRNPKPLTTEDAAALADPLAAPSVAAVAPVLQGRFEVTYASESQSPSVLGVTPDYATLSSEHMLEGDFIDDNQLLGRSAVAVLGPETAERLFGASTGVVDQTIRIGGQPFRVIGVLEAKGGSGMGSQDNRVLIPLSTAQARLIKRAQADSVDVIYVQAATSDQVEDASAQVSEILRLRHRARIGEDDFTIISQQQILESAASITDVLTIFLGGIGAISLLVGGIGIMNIMLVSVTERTREIGLRKAIGARRMDILVQFLTESMLLSLFGGLLGIALAWLITTAVAAVAAASNTPFTPVIGINAVLLATLFSTAIGLLFGLYPANRAASLQPVEALRFE
ncbi:MAG: FtsX-like permease family protein [Chloroflexi bacterium]|nr:ABC transporter permease [Anaerolineaceae bacterium]NMB90783.1 FtsX-like permease family protein [Chloroflexota bacterium]